MGTRIWSDSAALFGEDRERVQGLDAVALATGCTERAAERWSTRRVDSRAESHQERGAPLAFRQAAEVVGVPGTDLGSVDGLRWTFAVVVSDELGNDTVDVINAEKDEVVQGFLP